MEEAMELEIIPENDILTDPESGPRSKDSILKL
jgi:hypothetical protein